MRPLTPIDGWFPAWLDAHLVRHAREGLPTQDSEEGLVLYESWVKLFRLRGVHDLDVATAASERLMAEPPRHASRHFATLLEYALEVYRDRAPAPESPGLDARESAALASRGCPRCSGAGLLCVWSPGGQDYANRIPETVAAYCVCALGRWIECNHRERSPDVRKRMVDLADVLAGRSAWLADPPWMTADVT